MTSFFEHQDRARRNTRMLLWLMAIAVLAMGLSLYALVIVVQEWGGLRTGTLAVGLRPEVLLWTVGGTAVLVVIASLARMLSLRGGGASVAEMLGGRLVSGSPRDVLERRLLNVVEEMAIASGVPVPQVFVLDEESGINAFAAGMALDDAAIAVTRGCLEKLTREQLQGVIAHEFSHVLNGDMRLNIRLMGIVFGIVCIGLFGRFLMRAGSRATFMENRRRDASPAAAFFMLGLGVFLIGTVGELFGKLIRAAVSRQREFLADASAVQFTRNPLGIAGALKTIGGYTEGGAVHASHAEEASHFFFGDIHKRLFAGSVLATHPPLAERIRRVDPSFHGEFPEVGPGIAEPEEGPISALQGGLAYGDGAMQAGNVVTNIGTTSPQDLDRGRQLLSALPAALREAASSPFAACATVYALLLSDDAKVQAAQCAQVQALSSSALTTETLRTLALVRDLSRRDRLSLVGLLAPALRQLSADQRAGFTHTVQALIDADATLSIFEYVVSQTLRERLSDESPAHVRGRMGHRTLHSVGSELQLLLSLLAHAGAFDGAGAEAAFAAGVARLPDTSLRLLPQDPRLLSGLAPALQELRSLAPQRCAEVVDACAHTVLADRRVTEDEATLLAAVCEALGCPLPPFAALSGV